MAEIQLGQLARRQDRFCPFAAVAKFPYRYMKGDESQKKAVAEAYFDSGQFKGREWSLYYIRTLLDTPNKPLLLIPQAEVEALFEEIKYDLGIFVRFPDETKCPGFQIGFQEEGSPRPRYLGRLSIESTLIDLQDSMPAEGAAPEQPDFLDDRSFPAFRAKMEAAVQAGKNSTRAMKDKKKKARIVQNSSCCAQLKRAQCYLGVRPRGNTAHREHFHADPNATWEDSKEAQKAYEKAAGLILPELDPKKAVPYDFDQSVVFVCVDIEAYERDHKKITEIGISTLDTLDIIKTPPGEGGIEWMKHIRARHFRIVETSHLRNTEFIQGCAENFREEFGSSEWISINEAPQVIAACFRTPFSAPEKYTPHPADMRSVPRNGSNIQPLVDEVPKTKRKIILVGHDIRSDIDYLRRVGYDVGNLSNLVEAIDTADIYRAFKHEQNPSNLGKVLLSLGLTGWFLHNAGNDAAYTMQALIGISIAALSTNNKSYTEGLSTRLEAAVPDAKQRIIEEDEEWVAAEEEGGDGGHAALLLPSEEAKATAEPERGMNRAKRADGKAERCDRQQPYTVRGAGSPSKQSTEGSLLFHNADEKIERQMGAHSIGTNYTTGSTQNDDPRKTDHVPPHLRGLSKPKASESETHLTEHSTQPEVVLPPLSKRLRKRLVIMEDDDMM